MFVESFLFEKPSKAHISDGVIDYLLKIYLDIENLKHKLFKMRVEFKHRHHEFKLKP